MIKTTIQVTVPTPNGRDVQQSTVYAKINDKGTQVRENDYLPHIEEFVIDETEYTFINDQGEEETAVNTSKRVLYRNESNPMTIQEVEGLIVMLKDANTLQDMQLNSLVGVYENIPTLSEKVRFVMRIGLLLDYNARQRRGTFWEFDAE